MTDLTARTGKPPFAKLSVIGVGLPTLGQGWRFDNYELDADSGKLLRDGWPVKIQPQPLRVLSVLVRKSGHIVTREEIRSEVWGPSVFVDFEQGLNYSIRQIRLALRDGASGKRYIETVPRQGYRFVGDVSGFEAKASDDGLASGQSERNGEQVVIETLGEGVGRNAAAPPVAEGPAAVSSIWSSRRVAAAIFAAMACAAGIVVHFRVRSTPTPATFEQLTDFVDSALAPVLSPDGKMLAFYRGNKSFLTADDIYVKLLPGGETKRITNDPRLKYGLAFSPDGTQIAYTVLDPPNWTTYTVSVLGGERNLLLKNAAGLTWLNTHELLYSTISSGQHMGLVSGELGSLALRTVYFPPHQRAMAHYSFASPDKKRALVVEMNGAGRWDRCRLVALENEASAVPIGPQGACTAAGWSPDGSWMYFAAAVDGKSHLWRQHFPNGDPEQLTFGPTEEEGLAVSVDGESLITSVGTQQTSLWLHTPAGDKNLSSEGDILRTFSTPLFSPDGRTIFYLMQHKQSANAASGLWSLKLDTGKSEQLLRGVSPTNFDISADQKEVVYSTKEAGGKSSLWIAPVDASRAPLKLVSSVEADVHFGMQGSVLFRYSEGNFNYLGKVNPDGSGRSRLVPYPISELFSVSPQGNWIVVSMPNPDAAHSIGIAAIPAAGGAPHLLCSSFCVPVWSPNGKYIYIPVADESHAGPGRSLAIPLGPNETFPPFPERGIEPFSTISVIPGLQSVNRSSFSPGLDPNHYAYVNTSEHRNLYRFVLPR